jgi:hypothetical protein
VTCAEQQLFDAESTVAAAMPSPVCIYVYFNSDPCDADSPADLSTLPSATDPLCAQLCYQGTPPPPVSGLTPSSPQEGVYQSDGQPFAQAVIDQFWANPTDSVGWEALLDAMKDTILEGGAVDGLGVTSPDAAFEQVQAALDCVSSAGQNSDACTVDAFALIVPPLPEFLGGSPPTSARSQPPSLQFPMPVFWRAGEFPFEGHAVANNRAWRFSWETTHKECDAFDCYVDGRVTGTAIVNPGAVTSRIDESVSTFDPQGFFSGAHFQTFIFCYRSRVNCGSTNGPDLYNNSTVVSVKQSPVEIGATTTLNGDRISFAANWWVLASGTSNWLREGAGKSALASCNVTNNSCRWS